MNILATERVARGAALLDEKKPGWLTRINLDLLDVADGTRCIGGQLSDGHFWQTMQSLGLAMSEASEYGFNGISNWASRHGDPRPTFAELTEAWRELIIARRVDTLLESVEQGLADRVEIASGI